MEEDAGRVHRDSAIPIALDEELIGVHDTELRRNLLHIIQAGLHHPEAQPDRRTGRGQPLDRPRGRSERRLVGHERLGEQHRPQRHRPMGRRRHCLEDPGPCRRAWAPAACSPTTSTRPWSFPRAPCASTRPEAQANGTLRTWDLSDLSRMQFWRFPPPAQADAPDWVAPFLDVDADWTAWPRAKRTPPAAPAPEGHPFDPEAVDRLRPGDGFHFGLEAPDRPSIRGQHCPWPGSADA